MSSDYQNLYTKVQSILHIDLLEAASTLEQMFPDAFVEPKAGIYLLDETEPVITSDQRFYELITKESGELEYKLLEDIETAKGSIVNSNGEIVITAQQLKHKAKMLSNAPTVPSSAISFVRYTLMHEVYSSLRKEVVRSSNYNDKAESFLTAPKDSLGLTDPVLEKVLSHEYCALENFMRTKDWHIHWFRANGTSMQVNQGPDWRIIEYYRLTQPADDSGEEMSSEGYDT